MNNWKKQTLSIFLLFIVFIYTFVYPYTILANNSVQNVRGIEEPFFIQFQGEEILAANSLLTIDDAKYVPLRDVADILGYTISPSGNQTVLTGGNSIQNEQKITNLPKKHIPINSTNLTFQTSVAAQGALIAENSSDHIMFQKNGATTFYPASTTKLMTALIAIEKGNLKDIVTVSNRAVQVPYDSSRAYILPGDKLTLEQLLYALLLPSGNDAAVAIAEHIAGSEQKFVQLMNERAKQLGATKTNFVNAHGYHHPNHYTTPQDLAKIAFAVAKHQKLINILGAPSYTAYYKNKNGKTVSRKWTSTNKMNHRTSPYYHSAILGGKTGFTSAALHNLVSIARSKNDLYVIVVLRGHNTKRYTDTLTMFSKAQSTRATFDKTYPRLRNVVFKNEQAFLVNNDFIYLPTVQYKGRTYIAASHIEKLFGYSGKVSNKQQYKVTLDEVLVPFTDAEPINENGRLLVPFRQLFSLIGFSIDYDNQTRTITAQNEEMMMKLQVDSQMAYVNDTKVSLDVKPKIVQGRTLVPVRFVGETIGYDVDWGIGRTLILQ